MSSIVRPLGRLSSRDVQLVATANDLIVRSAGRPRATGSGPSQGPFPTRNTRPSGCFHWRTIPSGFITGTRRFSDSWNGSRRPALSPPWGGTGSSPRPCGGRLLGRGRRTWGDRRQERRCPRCARSGSTPALARGRARPPGGPGPGRRTGPRISRLSPWGDPWHSARRPCWSARSARTAAAPRSAAPPRS